MYDIIDRLTAEAKFSNTIKRIVALSTDCRKSDLVRLCAAVDKALEVHVSAQAQRTEVQQTRRAAEAQKVERRANDA